MSHNFIICNADTDSISFCRADGKPISKEEREHLVEEINSLMPEKIRWEDDGYFKRFIVIKSKNYILQSEDGKVKIKGSGLKATTKERALQNFIREIIDLLLKDRKDAILFTYLKYAKEILNLTSIDDWCVKKTITKSVLNPERTNEQRVLDALAGSDYREGDKARMFNRDKETLCLQERFDGQYCADTLLGKLYDTLSIFETVVDVGVFPDFTLKRNRELLEIYCPVQNKKAFNTLTHHGTPSTFEMLSPRLTR